MISGQSVVTAQEQPLAVVESLIGKPVTIITSLGTELDGTLKGFDQTVNCVLSDVAEYNTNDPALQRRCDMTLVNGATISIITEKLPR